MLAGLLLVSVLGRAQDSLVTRCASTERDSVRLLKNPALRNLRIESEQAIQHYLRSTAGARTSASEVITIPVVVHVVHNRADNVIGGAGNGNISDAQIQSQIDVLNEDYGNTSGYKGFYTDSLGVDTGIRFRLVSVVRTYNTTSQFSPITDADDLAMSYLNEITRLNKGRAAIHVIELNITNLYRQDSPLQIFARQNKGTYKAVDLSSGQ